MSACFFSLILTDKPEIFQRNKQLSHIYVNWLLFFVILDKTWRFWQLHCKMNFILFIMSLSQPELFIGKKYLM